MADNSAVEPDEIREKLREALAERGVTPAALSLRMGRSIGYVGEFLRGKKATLAAAESAMLEGELGLTPGSLVVSARQRADEGVQRLAHTPEMVAPARAPLGHFRPPPAIFGAGDLPVFSATEGGKGEMVVSTDPIEMVPRPWYLKNVRDGYAVVVTGESMEPRYSPGEIVVVNPRAALVRGKDAIITTAREGGDFRAMIKTYLGATADSWKLRQFNPPDGEKQDFSARKREWPFAVRVVGRYDGG